MRDLHIFETHAHYDDRAFDDDRDELISSMPGKGIKTIINIAADIDSVETTYELTQKYDYVYGAIGIHPDGVKDLTEEHFERLRELGKDLKTLAIGEIGLDYHYPDTDKEAQKYWFIRQLQLARELNKPVVIHTRDACEDTMNILRSADARGIPGVVHCYSYTVETARELLKLGYYFGIGGVVTFSNGKKLVETVAEMPMDKLLLETDCPYLAPTPHRGERNDSGYLPLVAEKIASIKGLTYAQVVDQTCKNARKLFMGKN